LRQIDDAVYHEDIRRIHLDLIHLRLGDLLKSNNNGYGWISWMINGILGLPCYLLYLARPVPEDLR
jgi:hypothetical protein